MLEQAARHVQYSHLAVLLGNFAPSKIGSCRKPEQFQSLDVDRNGPSEPVKRVSHVGRHRRAFTPSGQLLLIVRGHKKTQEVFRKLVDLRFAFALLEIFRVTGEKQVKRDLKRV